MTNQSDVFVYELFTMANTATEASVGLVALSGLPAHPSARLYVWTVAVTQEQANRLSGLPWVVSARRRGQMHPNEDRLVFHDHERDETWSVLIESLAR